MNRFRVLTPLAVAIALASCSDPATSPLASLGEADARRPEPTRTLDLGTLEGARSWAWDVNDHVVVVGSSETSAGSVHAFKWTREGGMVDLGTLGGSTSDAVAINQRGYIAGTSSTTTGETHLVIWTPKGEIRDLGVVVGDPESTLQPVDITDHNEIVGDNYSAVNGNQVFHWREDGGVMFYPWHPGEAYAGGTNKFADVVGMFCCGKAPYYGVFFVERGTGFIDLGGITNYNASAMAISDRRVIVGWDEHDSGIQPTPYWIAPFRWTGRTGFQVLGSLGGDEGSAHDVNNRGEIVGSSSIEVGNFTPHAFYWSEGRGMVDLGPGRPSAINDRAQIVGTLNDRATMWTGTGGIETASRDAERRSSQRMGLTGGSCFTNSVVARSKSRLLQCLASERSG